MKAIIEMKDEEWVNVDWGNSLKEYMKNPVLFLNHNYKEIIGKVTEIKQIPEKGLCIEYKLSKEYTPDISFVVEKSSFNDKGERIIEKARLIAVSLNQKKNFTTGKEDLNELS